MNKRAWVVTAGATTLLMACGSGAGAASLSSSNAHRSSSSSSEAESISGTPRLRFTHWRVYLANSKASSRVPRSDTFGYCPANRVTELLAFYTAKDPKPNADVEQWYRNGRRVFRYRIVTYGSNFYPFNDHGRVIPAGEWTLVVTYHKRRIGTVGIRLERKPRKDC